MQVIVIIKRDTQDIHFTFYNNFCRMFLYRSHIRFVDIHELQHTANFHCVERRSIINTFCHRLYIQKIETMQLIIIHTDKNTINFLFLTRELETIL